MKLFLCLLTVLPLAASPTVSIQDGATQTQVALAIRNYVGTCTIEVSENPTTFTPLHPDVDPSLYAGAATDLGRTDTLVQSDGTRLVTIGHMNDDRALAVATAYYVRVSNCGGTVTSTFSTPTLSSGNGQQFPPPFNAAKPWNFGYPTINLLNPSWVVDPITGIKLKPLNSAKDRTWSTGGSTSGSTWAFDSIVGGGGWTNPTTITTGASSTATTSTQTPIDLYGLFWRFQFGSADCAWCGITYDDIAAKIWGSATDQVTANANKLTLCFFINPVQGCLGTPVTVTLSATSGTPSVDSSSVDPDHPWPSSFPSPFFSGWGMTASPGPEHVNTTDFGANSLNCVSVASHGVCTGPGGNARFPDTMLPGQAISISGTDPTCLHDVCTMLSRQSNTQVTLNEDITASARSFTVYMWGIRIQKVNTSGFIRVGVAYKHAGSLTINQANANFWNINPHGFTANGHFGSMVQVPATIPGYSAFYFVSDDGYVKNISNNIIWSSSTCYIPSTSGDLPASGGKFSNQATPDATDPRTWYITAINNSGSTSLYKLHYGGDTTENLDVAYQYTQAGDGPPAIGNAPCGGWDITNLMPASLSLDLVSQVSASPTWSGAFTTLYGNSPSSWLFNGNSGGYAFFQNSYSGQDNPAWIAQVNLGTGLLTKLMHTFDGTGTTGYEHGGMRWGGNHTVVPNLYTSAVLFVENPLGFGVGAHGLLSGPFEFTPLGLLLADGVTYDTDISLDYPIGSGTGSPHRASNPAFTTCPIGNVYEFMGATGNNCVTFKIPTGGACNVNPTVTEQANFPPCPWNGAFTNPLQLAVGDNFVDTCPVNAQPTCNGSAIGDFEHFRIISITVISGGLKVVAQRQAIYDYCAPTTLPFPNTNVFNGIDGPTQFQHISTWTAVMYPPRLNGCGGANFFYNPQTGAIVENGRLLQGHGDLAPGISSSSKISWLGGQVSIPDVFYSNVFNLPTVFNRLVGPTWQNVGPNIGGGIIQSYVSSAAKSPWMVDYNSINNGNGSNAIAAITINAVGGAPNVYIVTPLSGAGTLTNTLYKLHPLIGWAGRFLMHDISGPGSNIDAAPYGMCKVFVDGECHSGSSASSGLVYINVPNAELPGFCYVGVPWYTAPCVVIGFPGGGGIRQQRVNNQDPTGVGSRFLGYALTGPGGAYPYAGVGVAGDGSFALVSAHMTQGWGPMAWLLKLPPWVEDGANRTQFSGQLNVKVPPGAQYAEIQFGYSRYIGPGLNPVGNLFCSGRREICNTRADTSSIPFNYVSETRSLQSCPNGCVIPIPVVASNLIYFRVGQSPDGTNWTYGDVQTRAVQ